MKSLKVEAELKQVRGRRVEVAAQLAEAEAALAVVRKDYARKAAKDGDLFSSQNRVVALSGVVADLDSEVAALEVQHGAAVEAESRAAIFAELKARAATANETVPLIVSTWANAVAQLEAAALKIEELSSVHALCRLAFANDCAKLGEPRTVVSELRDGGVDVSGITNASGGRNFDFDNGGSMPEYTASPYFGLVVEAVNRARETAYRKQVNEASTNG